MHPDSLITQSYAKKATVKSLDRSQVDFEIGEKY